MEVNTANRCNHGNLYPGCHQCERDLHRVESAKGRALSPLEAERLVCPTPGGLYDDLPARRGYQAGQPNSLR